MSINPVHIQLMLQNTTDVHKFGVEASKPEMQQQHIHEHAQKETAHEAETVVKINKSEQDSIDEREGSNSGYHGNKKKSKKKNNKNKKKESGSENLFDVSI